MAGEHQQGGILVSGAEHAARRPRFSVILHDEMLPRICQHDAVYINVCDNVQIALHLQQLHFHISMYIILYLSPGRPRPVDVDELTSFILP